MKWTKIPSGQTSDTFQTSLGEKARVVVSYINTEFPLHDEERKVMGKNFFGLNEAMKHFRVDPTRHQFEILSHIPFSLKELEVCKNTHILVALVPLSIYDIRANNSNLFYKYKLDWHEQEFINDKGKTGWKLILKTPVVGSKGKNWDEQQPLIASDEKVQTARVMVYTVIGHFLNSGERLFEKVCVLTASSSSDPCDNHVFTGKFNKNGIALSCFPDRCRSKGLGLSVAKK